jgi:hypothetical protein
MELLGSRDWHPSPRVPCISLITALLLHLATRHAQRDPSADGRLIFVLIDLHCSGLRVCFSRI